MLRRLVAALLLCSPLAAAADPITVVATLAPYIGGAAAAFVASYGGYIALAGISIWRASNMRRKARQAEARRRAQYNASLQDRTVSAVNTIPPWRVVYGEAITGGDIVGVFTSDQVGYTAKGDAKTKPDGYKHLVIVLAAHEVQQIGEVYIDGVPLGPLDAGGWVQSGSEFYTDGKDIVRSVAFTGSATAIAVVQEILSAVNATTGAPVTVTGVGTTTLTGPAGVSVEVAYRVRGGEPTVRCSKHAGLPSDPGDSYLQSVVPEQWTAQHLLRGCAYIVITLDLEQSRFQGGPPGITASVKGRRVYDPRKDSTRGGAGGHRVGNPDTWEWSANPALCVRDWLTQPWGYECDPIEDIDDAYTVAAANACDVVIDIGEAPADGGARVPLMAPTYTCNGVLTTDGSRESQLEDLCESMVGAAVYGAQWQIIAGAWTAPVGTLTDDDLDGQIEIVQAGAAMDELFNGVRGSYIPAGKAAPVDFAPYRNAAFVASDGRELWTNIDLPFTDGKQRAANIARIVTERARGSQVIRYPAKLPAWRCRVGERITVTSAEYGLAAKTYRITDWQFGLDAPVTLTLEEDAAEIWDLADAVVADPTPNTALPSPWVVNALEGLSAESGTEHLLLQADGTIVTRVWVTWDAITDAYVSTNGRVRVRVLPVGANATWSAPIETRGDADGLYITGVQDGRPITIEAVPFNGIGAEGPARVIAHYVVGKTAPPDDVAGLTASVVQGGVLVRWTPATARDYAATRIRLGTSWASYSVEYVVKGSQLLIPWLALGTYGVHARHEDSTGNLSFLTASQSVVVDASAQIQWASVNGRPKAYRLAARGLSSTSHPIDSGLYDGESGALISGAGAMYRVRIVRRSDLVAVDGGDFNPLSGALGALGECNAMAALLNAYGPAYYAWIWTFDEPASNRLLGNLPTAMYRCGASRAVWGSPRFQFRSAYVLIGICGCGEGNGYEAYQGDGSSDPNAWVDVSFQVSNGQLLVTGMGATPRTLADYSYVGDLDATRGATFGVNISGQAQTSDIAPYAATLIHQIAYTSANIQNSGGSLVYVAGLSYTAAAAADNIATALGYLTASYAGVGGPTPISAYAQMWIRRNGVVISTSVADATSQPSPTTGRVQGTFAFEQAFAVSAGDAVSIELYGLAGSAFTSGSVSGGYIKAEEIKR